MYKDLLHNQVSWVAQWITASIIEKYVQLYGHRILSF